MLIPVGAGNSFCGASLINARTALTAAHCVDKYNMKSKNFVECDYIKLEIVAGLEMSQLH